MCLKVDNSIKPLKPNKDGFCTAWKIVKKDNTSLYSSLYGKYKYKIGENKSNRDDKFIYGNEVDKGLHLFPNRRIARNELKWYRAKCFFNKYFKIIKVYFNPKDVIAYGRYCGDKNCYSIAVMKLTVKSLKSAG